jgi:hypothetical protein
MRQTDFPISLCALITKIHCHPMWQCSTQTTRWSSTQWRASETHEAPHVCLSTRDPLRRFWHPLPPPCMHGRACGWAPLREAISPSASWPPVSNSRFPTVAPPSPPPAPAVFHPPATDRSVSRRRDPGVGHPAPSHLGRCLDARTGPEP